MAAGMQEARDTGTLYIRINTVYDDNADSLRQIKLLIKYLVPSEEVLRPGQTISEFSVEHFSLGPTDLPQSYQLIEDAILHLNRLARPEDARAGVLLVPTLPRRKSRGGLKNWAESVGMSATRTQEMVAETEAKMELFKALPTTQPNEPPPNEFVFPIVVPLVDLRSPEGQSLLKDPNTALVEEPMILRYASGRETIYPTEDYLVLEEAERQQIKSWLRNDASRSPVVFILDSGWPSLDAYLEAKSTLIEAFDQVWAKWAIPVKQRFKRKVESDVWKKPSNTHCQTIEHSLKEFRDLDSNHRVRVIYLPLILEEQPGAELLQELFELYFISRSIDAPLGEQAHKISRQVIKEARNSAKSTLTKIKVGEELGEDVLSNKALLQATWILGNYIAGRDDTVFFVNESWTLRASLVEYTMPFLYGFPIAAAGNIPRKVVTSSQGSGPVDFARRSQTNGDVIAVMNFRKGVGWQCDSSIVDDAFLPVTVAVGFDGRVSEKDSECMTSYAAPRVAWLLACSESLRHSSPDRSRWPADLKLRLLLSRSDATGLDQLIFDPIKYMRGILNN